MSTRVLAPAALVGEPAFRRHLIWSFAAHAVGMVLLLVSPLPRSLHVPLAPVFVEIVSSPRAAPAASAARPRQVVKEPVVIPKQPRAKPKPKPKLKPKPKPKPKPAAKAAPLPTRAQLMAELRRGVRERSAAAAAAGLGPATGQRGGAGRFDPEMAAYERRLRALLYSNWVGAQAFRRRGDLVASLRVELDVRGGVRSVEVTGSSGDRYFDESAERAIWKTRPFPPPPRGALTLTVRFDPRERL